MRLRHQALTLAVGLACLAGGGCARILGSFLAPQEAAMQAAGQVAGKVTAPARGELAGMGREVDRLLAGPNANQAELKRVHDELEKRLREGDGQGDAAQNDPDRLRPWHPRAEAEQAGFARRQADDALGVGLPESERALPRSGPLPDGIARGELQEPMALHRLRFRQLPK